MPVCRQRTVSFPLRSKLLAHLAKLRLICIRDRGTHIVNVTGELRATKFLLQLGRHILLVDIYTFENFIKYVFSAITDDFNEQPLVMSAVQVYSFPSVQYFTDVKP
jgi:hypothetical protein